VRVRRHVGAIASLSSVDEEQPVGWSPNDESLTLCSNDVKRTLDAIDEQQPVRECQMTGHRHGVPAAPKPSQFWWKCSFKGTRDRSPRVGVFFVEEDDD
jgi:hypothetical protein